MVSSSNVISCSGLTKFFKKRRVLDNINFELYDGINILAGDNGAGKSTLLYLINGIISPDAGSVRINGVDPVKQHHEVLSEVSFMPERPATLGSSSVKEYIYWFSSLKGTGKEEILNYMGMFGMDYALSSTFQSLSMGESQLVMLSCYLSTDSSIFMLDEPNSNLDVSKRSIVASVIRKKAKQTNSLFLISTHVFDEIMTIYDRILLLVDGSIKSIKGKENISFISVLRTDKNDLMLDLIKKLDNEASLNQDSIFTSLGMEDCARLANENGVRILSFFSLPGEMGVLYE